MSKANKLICVLCGSSGKYEYTPGYWHTVLCENPECERHNLFITAGTKEEAINKWKDEDDL